MMSLGIRKLIVLALVGLVFLIANILLVANWLQEEGVVEAAGHIRAEYLTGTAITIIVALLVLLVRPGRESSKVASAARRCPVCDHGLASGEKYCGECGSRV